MFTYVSEDQNMHGTVCPECYFITGKALTYSRLKTEKDETSYCRIDVLAFRSIFHHCGTVWYTVMCKCLNIAECFASVLISALGLATKQVITTEKRVSDMLFPEID